ncbi:hypothetical protein RGR602_PC00934 (plasmid) [Rhizobium gallicum bv. gallicum R602sp]|uniref:Uncharacterized protein n=1 Tax=Rhizobium gallicum bv. gallicum R602sp TaxID=1041138 RepID=A0A0B4XET3_9HYPH|nr:hypothetical protein RGR602_PC00934 [Rhizobium gallicum bv. gallicum R602sp]
MVLPRRPAIRDKRRGIKRVDLNGSITYMMPRNWDGKGIPGAGLLLGDAKDGNRQGGHSAVRCFGGIGHRF